MNDMPLVSVGLPTYNRASDLKRAIESVLNQDYSNLELIISDNASTDETESICEEFCAKDSRVKYIRQSSNRGPNANFNQVLQVASGDFFMWLGDDDWLESSYVSQCTQKLIENPDYSLVCARAKYYQDGQPLPDQGETIDLLQDYAEDRVLAYYAQVNYNATFFGVMRRKQLLFAKPQNVFGGDWLLVAAVAFMGRIETIKDVLINRSFAGASRDLKAMAAMLGVSPIHARLPVLSIALSACKDIAWRSEAYASISRRARFSLAVKVFAVFCWRYWRAIVHSCWTRIVATSGSERDKIRERDSA